MRSFLFAPASRERFVRNFAKQAADAYCIDLEDGTAAADKDAARADLPALVAKLREGALSGLLFVRINDPASPLGQADLAACAGLALDGLAIPKVAAPDDLRRLAPALDAAAQRLRKRWMIVAILESVAGIANARAIAAAAPPGCALAFGAEDFATEMGARRTPEGFEVLHARSEVVLAARLHGLAALDQVVVEVRDDGRFAADAKAGRDLGYDGKMCLTPRQVEQANAAFAPSAEEVAQARRLLAAFETAGKGARGAIDFEGRMVDAPLVERARRLLAKAGG